MRARGAGVRVLETVGASAGAFFAFLIFVDGYAENAAVVGDY